MAGSVASIAGLLGQIDLVPALAPLATAVPLPAWTIAAAVGVSAWLLPRAVGRAVKNASEHLSRQLQEVAKRTRQLEVENDRLKGALKTRESSDHASTMASARLAELQQKFDAYEALETEIMGLLRSGGEYDLLEIAQKTSAGGSAEGQRRVLRALEKLGANKVEGLGGALKKYRIRPGA